MKQCLQAAELHRLLLPTDKNGGSFEVAFVIRMLFRLLTPPFGLFFENILKFQSPSHVICSSFGSRKLQPSQRHPPLALF
jgi:hypothetical protein